MENRHFSVISMTQPVQTDHLKFVGSFSPYIIHDGDKTRFYLGAGDQLYWAESDVTISSCRAYFELLGGLTLDGVNASAIQLNFDGEGETTDLSRTSYLAPRMTMPATPLAAENCREHPLPKGFISRMARK